LEAREPSKITSKETAIDFCIFLLLLLKSCTESLYLKPWLCIKSDVWSKFKL